MMCSKYMCYSDNVDGYLQNRSHPMIRHCLLKKSPGENMDNAGIRITRAENFLYANTKMVKSNYTILILVMMKESLLVLFRLENVEIPRAEDAIRKSFEKTIKAMLH